MAVEVIGFDREDIKPQSFKGIKFKQGKTVKGAIVFLDESTSPLKHIKAHYHNRYFECKSTKDNKEICCTHAYKNNVAKNRIGAPLVLYEISTMKDETGKAKEKLTGYEVVPWMFNEKVYAQLVSINSEYPLKNHDIKITCDNEEYQNLTINNSNTCYWRLKKELENRIVEEAKVVFENIDKGLAQVLSIEEIREVLGIDSAGTDDAATDMSLNDVLDK